MHLDSIVAYHAIKVMHQSNTSVVKDARKSYQLTSRLKTSLKSTSSTIFFEGPNLLSLFIFAANAIAYLLRIVATCLGESFLSQSNLKRCRSLTRQNHFPLSKQSH